MSNVAHLTSHLSKEEGLLVEKAYRFAEDAHADQLRLSGEPYFTHLIGTATILAELGMGGTTIAAGLLHDTVEDQDVSIETLEREFGSEVAFIVDAVTKLGHVRYRGADKHNESLRKLFVATSEDIRVLLVKLADRLHNMRTLEYVPKEKQKRIATETLEIYAPIAYRLGIRKLNRELEDLAFPYVYPKEHEAMQKTLKQRRPKDQKGLEKFLRSVKKALAKQGITHVKTEYRVKGLYSLYTKLLRKEKDLEKIYDLSAARILVEKEEDCYQVLGIIHSTFRPLPGRIKDYISFPKPNGYQALQTTVFTGDGSIIEVQIKTFDMHKHSEYGIASHVSYKNNKIGADKETIAWINSLLPKAGKHSAPHSHLADVPSWIRELVAYREDSEDVGGEDFFSHRIFAFSPKGDVVDLPLDSTTIDFAYAIHSDIGDHMQGAKVNGKLASLDTTLKNGDIVDIMTHSSAKPNKKWLDFAKTSTARRHIQRTLFKLSKRRT
ncbi:MAG: (p)ppGpp synthetase SpoT/RelA, pyrophosphokinae [Parcubacteria group bacterium]|nr:(p)ppGpp synthetase SpoT/RelA, pyrophosphokinae [Parcubacteria group bacterium]